MCVTHTFSRRFLHTLRKSVEHLFVKSPLFSRPKKRKAILTNERHAREISDLPERKFRRCQVPRCLHAHKKASWRRTRMLLSSCFSEGMLFQITEHIRITRTRSHTSGHCWRLIANKLELLDLHIQRHTRRTISIGIFARNEFPLDVDLLPLPHIRVDRLRLLAERHTVEPSRGLFVLRLPCHGDRKLRDRRPIRGIAHLWVTPQIADKGQLCHAHCQFLLQYDTDSFFFWTSRSVAQQTYARFPLYSLRKVGGLLSKIV